MMMAPRLHKFALTAHVAFSVGWLGAVACSLALSVGGLISRDAQVVRGAYVALDLIGRFVLIPLSLASLVTGLMQALGTRWGLFRHYWVVVKLLMNLLATGVLVLYTQTLQYLARLAKAVPLREGDLSGLRDASPLVHASGAVLLLLVATTLSVYKPRGMTRYGQRKQLGRRAPSEPRSQRLRVGLEGAD